MEVRLAERVTWASEEQPEKASSPIETRPAGRVTETREAHSQKAQLAMVVPSGTVTCPCASIEGRTAQKLMARTAAFASSSRGQSKKAPSPIERPSGSGSVTEAREEQPQKENQPMEARSAGRSMETRAEQRLKALTPMEVRPAGKVTRAREEQPSKALPLMETRPAGRAAEVREEQLAKAPVPMEVRVAGRSMEAREEHLEKAASPIEARPAGKVTEVRAGQLWKAKRSMEARLAGRSAVVRAEQLWKAEWPMEARLLGKATETRVVRLWNARSGRYVMPSGSTACSSVTTSCQPPASKVSEPGGGAGVMAGVEQQQSRIPYMKPQPWHEGPSRLFLYSPSRLRVNSRGISSCGAPCCSVYELCSHRAAGVAAAIADSSTLVYEGLSERQRQAHQRLDGPRRLPYKGGDVSVLDPALACSVLCLVSLFRGWMDVL